MPRNIDISLLRTFDAVVEAGSLTAASKLLSLSQAAVSLQLKRLEEAFGHRLIDRSRTGLQLTPYGERLLPQAKQLLRENDEVWSLMTAPEFEGEVRLGIPSDLVRSFATPLLRRFDRERPRIRVTLVCDSSGRLIEQLDRRDIDVALIVQPADSSLGETLKIEPLVWAGARNGVAYCRNPLPIATGDQTCPHRPAALRALADAGRDWRFVCEVASFEAICAPVEADIAVTALLPSTVPPTLEILKDSAGLPQMISFRICLVMPSAGVSEVTMQLACNMRELHRT